MRAYVKEMTGGLSHGMRWFIATECLFGIGAGIFALILNLHLLALGFSKADIGQITSLGALATGLISLPVGLLVQWVGRKPMLVLGMALTALSLIGFAYGTSKTAVTMSQLAMSVATAAIVTTEIQLLFQYCRDKRDERQAYSLLFAAFTLFTGVGTLLGGYLPNWVGGVSTIYQYSFLAAAACFAFGGLLRAVLLPGSGQQVRRLPKDNAEAAAHVTTPERITVKLSKRESYRTLTILCAVIFLSGCAYGLLTPYLNVILKYRFTWGDAEISLLLTISGLFLFVGSLIVPLLLERAGVRKTFGLLFAGNALCAFLLALTVPASLFSALLLVRGGLFAMLSNVIDSEAMSAVPEQDRNLFAGVRTIARGAGNALAAYATGWILSASDYVLPFVFTGITIMLGYGLYVWFAQPILERPRVPSA